MKTDGLFTVHAFKIPLRTINEPVKLVFFGDVHRDSPNHASKAWQDFLAKVREYKHAWYFGMGDYLDSTSTSERGCLGKLSHDMHETFLNDVQALQDAKIEMIAGELKFMRNRLIGLLNGNHYFNFQDGTNSDQRLCRLLDCKYLGVSSFVRLTFSYGPTNCRTLDIWAHHGTGAGRLFGGSINRVDQMREHAEADFFVMGHDHKRGIVPATPRLYMSNEGQNRKLQIKQRQQWLIRSGSFLASYNDGTRNYNVDAGRGPCSLGHVEVEIYFDRLGDIKEIRGIA